MSQRVVVDANRIFSELISANQRLRQVFASGPDIEFYCPKYVVVELFKHKERIVAATALEESALLAPMMFVSTPISIHVDKSQCR